MKLSKLRDWLYKGARGAGDLQAIRNDKVEERIARRALGKAVGKGLFGQIFKHK